MTVFPHGGAAAIWRDLEAGVAYNPNKSQIRDWAALLENMIQAGALTTADWIAGVSLSELPDFVATTGYGNPGDFGGALWKKVASEPVHGGKREFTNGVLASWYELIVDEAMPEMLGADRTGVSDSTVAFADTFDYVISKGVTGRSTGLYKWSDSLGPGARYVWNWGETRINPVVTSPTSYTEIQQYTQADGGAPSGMGKYVVFDTSGCGGSINQGWLSMLGANTDNSMRMEKRALIPENLCAISGATSASEGMKFDTLSLQDFGHGLLQGDMRGTTNQILPYTRWHIRELQIVRCLVGLRSGQSGRGFDDMKVDQVRMSRCAGTSIIRGTTMQTGSFFTIGLDVQDFEPETLTYTNGSVNVVMSAESAYVEIGSVIASETGGLNKAGGPIGFAARVVGKSGAILTLSRAPEVDATGVNFVIDPPEVLVESGSLLAQQVYIERMTKRGAVVGQGGRIKAQEGKVSGGPFASLDDAFVSVLGAERAAVEFAAQSVAVNSDTVKSLVAVGSQRDASDYSDAEVLITGCGVRGKDDVNSDPIRIIPLDAEDLAAGYVDASNGGLAATHGDHNPRLNLRAEFSDGIYSYGGAAGGPSYVINGVSYAIERVADISTATAQGNFGAVSGGASSKSADGLGRLRHFEAFEAGELYLISVRLSDHVTGTPEARWMDDLAQVGSGQPIGRANGRYVFVMECPALSLDNLGIFAFSGGESGDPDDFTVREFTVDKLLAVRRAGDLYG